ncbi:hypothetical protein E2C01_024737 [Portunus trituberculatus]|uniref:Uncharacterized protein n=1 Tax=Portunus trituberculatus TaxID=210409 RepID=A0A5B7ED66_PORTR|nr:hypothetical protein [Portunus trituberculatus]
MRLAEALVSRRAGRDTGRKVPSILRSDVFPSSRGDSGLHCLTASLCPGSSPLSNVCLSRGSQPEGVGKSRSAGTLSPAGVSVGRLGGAGARQGPSHHPGPPPPLRRD